jgi:hypothetical protein
MRRRRRSSIRPSPAAAWAAPATARSRSSWRRLLANAALHVLLFGFSLQLALLVGPALGGLIVTVVVLGIAFLLVRYGAAKLGALGRRSGGAGGAEGRGEAAMSADE